jgi:hypothetical protein
MFVVVFCWVGCSSDKEKKKKNIGSFTAALPFCKNS